MESFDLKTEMLDLVEGHGLSVIPVRRGDKKPCIPWKEYQTRKPTKAEINAWAKMYPDAAIAIVTGAKSNLVVIDTDGPQGLEWAKEHLPRTSVFVQAKGGQGHWHYFFRHIED